MPETSSRLELLSRFALPLSILVAAVLISGTIFYTNNRTAGTANLGAKAGQPVDIKLTNDDHVLGNSKAKVTIVEYSDFQCPFCRKFWEDAYAQIKTDYIDTGKAKLIYRHFPLSFHAAAEPSAVAVECAAEQGKFWELHDKLFAEQAKQGSGTVEYGLSEIKQWASEIGLNNTEFTQCLDSEKYNARIQNDISTGGQYGVDGTPTTFINGQPIVGAQPYSAFKAAIDAELK